jgi:hypothetical protein
MVLPVMIFAISSIQKMRMVQDFPGETLRVLKENEEPHFGEYRTRKNTTGFKVYFSG